MPQAQNDSEKPQKAGAAQNDSETPQKVGGKKSDKPKKETEAVSRPSVKRKVTLNSRHAQQTFKRAFETASRAFYSLDVILRIIGTEENAREVETVVEKLLTEVATELTNEAGRMDRLLEDNGIVGEVNYNNPVVVEVEITTPNAHRFLGMIQEMDRLIARIELLWLSQALNNAQHSNGAYMWQRRLIRTAGKLRDIAQRAVAAAKRKGVSADTELDDDIPAEGADDLAGEPEAAAAVIPASTKKTDKRSKRNVKDDAAQEPVSDAVAAAV
jgi:hypothetical protein